MQASKTRIRLFSVGFAFGGLFLVGLGLLLYAGIQTNLYLHALEKGDLAVARSHSHAARLIVTPLSLATFQTSSLVQAWRAGLLMIDDLETLSYALTDASHSLAAGTDSFSLKEVSKPLDQVHQKLTTITQARQSSSILQRLISAENQEKLKRIQQITESTSALSHQLLNGKQTWVVLFQNSDELRATGGFQGSYALITLTDGVISETVIEDIYDADGQFTGFIEAPPGVKEYTSSNNGLRLPDANWFPHYPETAQTVLQFFALGNKRNLAGSVSITMEVAEKVLLATGPVTLPDYQTTVTAQNFTEILHTERDTFFAGSLQKKHLLSQLFAVLKQKVAELPADKQLSLFFSIAQSAAQKDIQAYGVDPATEQLFTKLGISGELGVTSLTKNMARQLCPTTDAEDVSQSTDQNTTTPDFSCQKKPLALYLVESNVGINKANRFITRTVDLTKESETKAHLTLTFTNAGQIDSKTLLTEAAGRTSNPKLALATNGYANYQRLLTDSTLRIAKVTINGQEEKNLHSQKIEYEPQGSFIENGFLVIVLPQSSTTVDILLESTDPAENFSNSPLLLQKQAGLTPPVYTLHGATGTESFPLEQDTLVELP